MWDQKSAVREERGSCPNGTAHPPGPIGCFCRRQSSEKKDLSIETPSPPEYVALSGKNNMWVGPVRTHLPNLHFNQGIRNLHKADAGSIWRQGWGIGIRSY